MYEENKELRDLLPLIILRVFILNLVGNPVPELTKKEVKFFVDNYTLSPQKIKLTRTITM